MVFEFSVGIGGFVIGLGQISFFFSIQPPSSSVKALKRKMEKLQGNLSTKQQITTSLSEKDTNVLRGCFEGGIEFYVYICTCSADLLQTSFTSFDTLTKSNIKIDKIDLPTFYWLPKPYKSRFSSKF